MTEAGRHPWRLLTSMFLHGSWVHLLGNMWFLRIFGDNVEDAMTRPRFLALYLLSGLAAALAQVAASPSVPSEFSGSDPVSKEATRPPQERRLAAHEAYERSWDELQRVQEERHPPP